MPRVHAKQIWLSLLVAALFAPVFLSTGSADLRPRILSGLIGGLPVFSLLVVGLLILFTVLVWAFSSAAFGGSDSDGGSDQP